MVSTMEMTLLKGFLIRTTSALAIREREVTAAVMLFTFRRNFWATCPADTAVGFKVVVAVNAAEG